MRDTRRRVLALAVAALVVAGGAGAAVAATQSGSSPGRGGRPAGPMRLGPGHGHLQAVADYLGLTTSQLAGELRAGKSLADVAKAQGKSVDGLKAAIVAEEKEHLDETVAAGRLTAAQAAQILGRLQANVDALVDRTGAVPGRGPLRGPGKHLDGVASYLGLSVQQVAEKLRAGQTLAQIATAQGKSVDGLKAAIVAEEKEHLDEAVAAGRLTAAQAAQILERLQANVGDLVNRTGPPLRGFGRHRGR